MHTCTNIYFQYHQQRGIFVYQKKELNLYLIDFISLKFIELHSTLNLKDIQKKNLK
jgi:hypothetical protein